MEVTVSIEEGESLSLGIRTSCLKPDGTQASSSESTGWFKADHFRIERVTDDETSVRTIDNRLKTTDNKFYNLLGQQISNVPNGLYIQNGKIILNP